VLGIAAAAVAVPASASASTGASPVVGHVYVNDNTKIGYPHSHVLVALQQAMGVNVDFAPVADVPLDSNSFMYRAGRTFSIYPTKTQNPCEMKA